MDLKVGEIPIPEESASVVALTLVHIDCIDGVDDKWAEAICL